MQASELHPLERALLGYLRFRKEAGEDRILSESGLPDEGSYRRASQWLLSRGLIREARRTSEVFVELGPLGEEAIAAGGTPETLLVLAVSSGASDAASVQSDERFEAARWGSALGALLKAGAIRREGGLLSPGDPAAGPFQACWELVYIPLSAGLQVPLDSLPDGVKEYVLSRSPKRGKGRAEFVVSEKVHLTLAITPEGIAAHDAAGEETAGALTPAMLADGSWRTIRFRRYNLDMPPARISCGRLHPYRVFLDSVRRKFISMGFEEMRGSLSETEFWNNDALFMPQFHPARDIHDAYFLDSASDAGSPDAETLSRVAAAHENGWSTGSRGWGYSFDRSRALKPILRSQGTALSARCLGSGPSVPGKYFAIARCFRYDQVDATHLPDFFQIEGIVLAKSIGLRHLLGLLRLFAEQIAGVSEYRFYPAYFPFTEPSVELMVRHPGLGWIEMGGAGLFRPEVTLPLGVEVPVIAWGLGLDRMAMLAMGLSDIRDLLTPDLSRLRKMAVLPDRILAGGRRHAQDRD
jgi:phenylalanyl-tRNA synthetase alpha chain